MSTTTTTTTTPGREPSAVRVSTADDLQMRLDDTGAVASLSIRSRELTSSSAKASGFRVRDVAAGSAERGFEPDGSAAGDGSAFSGTCAELGLRLDATFSPRGRAIHVRGRLSDRTGADRAISLAFALPLDLAGWHWGDDIRRSRLIDSSSADAPAAAGYANTIELAAGATGTQSRYPLAAVYDATDGLAVAIDLDRPALYRLAYQPDTRQLRLEYDFGLVPETRRFPGGAEFSFLIYRFDPRWGFRAAFAGLTELFPDGFAVRATDQGIWMPFTDISTVEGWQDFGFKFHEGVTPGSDMLAFDAAHGIDAFQYLEPMTWWLPMDKGLPRTPEAAIAERDRLAAEPGDSRHHAMARLSVTSAMTDADGNPVLQFHDMPWCDGAVWSLNPNPYLQAQPNEGTYLWNDEKRHERFADDVRPQLAGMYLDSLEGYVTATLNFRREHFADTTVPLTFCPTTKRPALLKGLAVWEFTKYISDDLHRIGKLLFANGVPYSYPYLCPLLDLLGTEAVWLSDGAYQPTPDEQMCLWRTMSGAKPYLLLQNTDFDAFGADFVERYLQHSLFFGFYPSMFSVNAAEHPYWKNPAWYNGDRHLFRRYVPSIKRVAEAGWHPVTAACSDNPQVLLERFGDPTTAGPAYLTIFNPSPEPQTATIALEPPLLGDPSRPITELLSGKPLAREGHTLAITLPPYAVAVAMIENSR